MSTFNSTFRTFSGLVSLRTLIRNNTDRKGLFNKHTKIRFGGVSLSRQDCRNFSSSRSKLSVTLTAWNEKKSTYLQTGVVPTAELYLPRHFKRVKYSIDANHGQNIASSSLDVTTYLECSDQDTICELKPTMVVYSDFISESEEQELLKEIEPYMKRLRYERDHWDNVIDSLNS